MTTEQIIAKNIEARGGQAAMDKIESAKIQGKMIMQTPAGSMEAPITMYWAAPDKMRLEFTIQGMTGIQAYDGETGWTLMPFMGQSEPQKMTDQELEQAKNQLGDVRGPFYNPEDQGYTIEYVGETEVEGTPAYEVNVTRGDQESTYYLDQDHFLEFKTVATMQNPMGEGEITAETAVGDYKPVGDVIYAHSMDMAPEGAPAGSGQSIVIESVEWNVDLGDDTFAMPKAEGGEAGSER
jgi:outer membrane lipoprotein-sorting protein